MLLALSKLVNAGQLRLAYTEYELDEFTGAVRLAFTMQPPVESQPIMRPLVTTLILPAEALDHAMDAHRNTRILLKMPGFEQDSA